MNATPAIEALVRAASPTFHWAEVLVQASGDNYQVRHRADEQLATDKLQLVPREGLRSLASRTQQGAFRPLRSAPDLAQGWRTELKGMAQLEQALNDLYPGSVADWFATQQSTVPVTHYPDFTNRQTGMYRITQKLSDEQAQAVIRATCHSRFCLKQRLWTIQGLEPDPQGHKSLIPCLEPCAILLETARKAMRIEQEEKLQLELAPSELASLLGAAEQLLTNNVQTGRTADLSTPLNGRRLQLILEKYRQRLEPISPSEEE